MGVSLAGVDGLVRSASVRYEIRRKEGNRTTVRARNSSALGSNSLWATHLEEREVWFCKAREDKVDFGVKCVGAEGGAPSAEDGVCCLEHAKVDAIVRFGQAGDELLECIRREGH